MIRNETYSKDVAMSGGCGQRHRRTSMADSSSLTISLEHLTDMCTRDILEEEWKEAL